MSKSCNKCNLEKNISEYYVNNRNKDKLQNTCKECIKKNKENNKEKLREAQKKWREKNPDYMKNYEKTEKRKEYIQKYYQEHKEEEIKKTLERRKNNPEKYKEERKRYIENNREKVNAYHSNWKKEKREKDVSYKIKENISRRIRYELNTLLKGKKTKRTIEHLGCDINYLKEYLESKFTENICWDNYGKVWHIDHIIPCSSWNLSNDFENKCCWNYRNLQPLFSSDNQSKKDKFQEDDKIKYIDLMKTILI